MRHATARRSPSGGARRLDEAPRDAAHVLQAERLLESLVGHLLEELRELVLEHAAADEHEPIGLRRRGRVDPLEQVAAGLSNKEIGARLFVSENTVKTHSSRVFDKLGARRRTQAVQLGKELRLIP